MFIHLINFCDKMNLNVFNYVPFTIIINNTRYIEDELESFRQIFDFIECQKNKNENNINNDKNIIINKKYNEQFWFDDKIESLKKQYNALLRSCDPGDHILRNDVCASYVTLLIYTKDYQGAKRALDFMKEHNYDLMHDFNRVYFYVQHKLGLIPENYQNITSYYESQILKYDRNRAIVHIYKHEKSENSDNLDIQTFDKDIDIRELFPTMEMAIEKIKPNERRMSTDIYYVNMGEIIGYFGNQPATIIAVLTEAGTKNIHTMYPVILCKNVLYKRREEALIRTNIKPTAEKSRQ